MNVNESAASWQSLETRVRFEEGLSTLSSPVSESPAPLSRRGKPRPLTRHSVSTGGNLTVWFDTGPSGSAPVSSAYLHVEHPDPVIVPAGRAEPGALARFAGVMSEIFPGRALNSEDIDRAIRKLRGRE